MINRCVDTLDWPDKQIQQLHVRVQELEEEVTQLQITHPIGKSPHEMRLKERLFARAAENEEL